MAKGATHVLGLDIGSTAIKAAELQLSGGQVHLVGRPAVIPTPKGTVRGGVVVDAPSIAAVLTELKTVYGMKAPKVIASVGGDSSVVVRIAEVPKMTGKELKEAIEWEMEEQTPFPVDECIYDYAPIQRPDADPEATEMEVLLAVAQEDMVDAHVQAILGAKMRPVAIDIEPLAIGRALVDAAGDEYAEQTVVNVHIGATVTLILVFRHKLLSFVRLIPSAGENLTQALSQTLLVDEAQAEMVKLQLGNVEGGYAAEEGEGPGSQDMFQDGDEDYSSDSVFELSSTGQDSATIEPQDDRATHLDLEDSAQLDLAEGAAPPEAGEPTAPLPPTAEPQEEQDPDLVYARDQVAEALTNPVVDIATEVRRSIDFYRRQHRNEPVDRIMITGGTAKLGGLVALMQDETGVPTSLGDPFRCLVVDESLSPADYLRDIGPSSVVAVGLALRDMVGD